jgi:hypothetical protein
LFPEQRRRPNKKVPDESAQKIKRRERFILYAPLLIWIGVIFLLSSGQGASSRTSLIIRPILEFLFPAALPETIDFYHGVIRKFAHFTEYAVLGLLACRAFAKTHQASLRRFSRSRLQTSSIKALIRNVPRRPSMFSLMSAEDWRRQPSTTS